MDGPGSSAEDVEGGFGLMVLGQDLWVGQKTMLRIL